MQQTTEIEINSKTKRVKDNKVKTTELTVQLVSESKSWILKYQKTNANQYPPNSISPQDFLVYHHHAGDLTLYFHCPLLFPQFLLCYGLSNFHHPEEKKKVTHLPIAGKAPTLGMLISVKGRTQTGKPVVHLKEAFHILKFSWDNL